MSFSIGNCYCTPTTVWQKPKSSKAMGSTFAPSFCTRLMAAFFSFWCHFDQESFVIPWSQSNKIVDFGSKSEMLQQTVSTSVSSVILTAAIQVERSGSYLKHWTQMKQNGTSVMAKGNIIHAHFSFSKSTRSEFVEPSLRSGGNNILWNVPRLVVWTTCQTLLLCMQK